MFPSLRYTRLDPGCSLRVIYMTNGCIIPIKCPVVKQFFPKKRKKERARMRPFFFANLLSGSYASGR